MNDPVTVHKLDAAGFEVWTYSGVIVARGDSYTVLEAKFDRERAQVGFLNLSKGDRFIESYYNDRWYNVFEVHAAESDRVKGWYCNIGRPARLDQADIYYEDLALDLIVSPDGDVEVLDEDEFAALELPESDARQARRALKLLQERAALGQPPFVVRG